MTQIILSGQYDWRLVALSIAVAFYAAYAAFDLGGRVAGSQGRKQALWLACAATAMGLGIWAMHYIGMLAFILPVPILYNVPIVAFSLLIAIASSAVTLFVVSRSELSEVYLVGGSLAMGGGIAATHYSGLAAMRLAAYPVYNPGFAALSVVIAVVAAGAALQLARLRSEAKNPTRMRIASAAAMGFAIAAAHYTSMAAVSFHSAQSYAGGSNSVGAPGLSITGIALLTLAVLALSLIGSRVDRTFSLQRQLLLSEQERWLLIASASLDGLFDFDLVTGKVFYSSRWKAIAGYGPDELDSTTETWRQLVYAEDRQIVETALAEYLRGGQGAFEMEYRICHRDGSTRWIFARAQAVWDAQGQPIRLVGYHSDITERKQSEEKLRISEARYRELFDSNPMPCWIYSPANLRILDANQAAMDYYGWSRDQFLGLSVSSIRMPGEPEPIEEHPSQERTKPWRFRGKNARGIWVEPSSYKIEAEGAPARLMMVNDVTSHIVYQTKIEQAQRRLEGVVAQKTAALQTSEAQWHTLVEALPQFVWSARPDGFFDYFGNHWAEYAGVTLGELVGSGWLNTLHPADRTEVESRWLTALQTGGLYDIDYRIRAKDGTYRWFRAHGMPVRATPGGKITHWMGTSTEMEDRKVVQEDLELTLA
jgi:PAS domain S-box-containing protein